MGIIGPAITSATVTAIPVSVVSVNPIETLVGLPTIDGVLLTENELVLLTAQANSTLNGIWAVKTGAWVRPTLFNGTIPGGLMVPCREGTKYAGTIWILTSKSAVIETNGTSWQENAAGGTQAAEKTEFPSLTPALLEGWTKEQEWPYNVLPCGFGMWRWDARNGTLHANSTQIVAAIKAGSSSALKPGLTVTELLTEDFGSPIYLGRVIDAVVNLFSFEFGGKKFEWKKLHIPSYAKKTESGDSEYGVIDSTTGRYISNSTFSVSGHDLCKGPGYAPNSKAGGGEKIPFTGAAITEPGELSLNEELGGSSASLIAWPVLTTRFAQLKQADTNWRTAIPHPHPVHVPQTAKNVKAGLVTRGANAAKFGQGIVTEPIDGRLPYVWPAHQGEVLANGSAEEFAPPNGAWYRLNPAVWTEAFIEKLATEFSLPKWAMAVYWSWARYGAFQTDVTGTNGLGVFWPESILPYTTREGQTNVYMTWMLEKTDGTFLKKTGGTEGGKNRKFEFDITGGNATLIAKFFEGLQVVNPPTKPEGLQS